MKFKSRLPEGDRPYCILGVIGSRYIISISKQIRQGVDKFDFNAKL